ncbi:hypothetical protein V8C26DRAFT_392101 [Trichoderma gracile]
MRQSLAGATLPTDWILTSLGGNASAVLAGQRLLSPSDAMPASVRRGQPSEGGGFWVSVR